MTKDVDARFLPDDELAEVLASKSAADLFIGGAADAGAGALVLYKGDLLPLVVPLSMFKARPGGPAPDAGRLEVVDFGQTVRLGEFEAASDAIFYELDADYRRRAKARQREQDPSFGGSLKRLRLQKGLGRADFGGISAKEVARIERGQIKRPHPATLKKLAAKLGVAVEALGSF
ncbi:MAG: helix-turn-helix transcriptional regulator [Deltaproteobacteria bacterium]|nr:helix-turn-helix transcriptional regulator [Deltaproteobacteria bacterium]